MSLEILAFTDPVCTWCWGSEPVLRAVDVWYAGDVRIRPVMGGLVQDIRGFYDARNDIGGDPERSNAQIAKHWLEASAMHGMPVRSEGFRLFTADTPSSYPQNIAVKAAELTDPTLAPRYLRRLREATAVEARPTGRQEVLLELAGSVGLDVPGFALRLTDGSAEKAFQADLATTARHGVRGFPTFLLRGGDKEEMLYGHQDFQTMREVIEGLGGGTIVPRPPRAAPDTVLGLLKTYGRAAPVEVMTVFALSEVEFDTFEEELETAGLVRRVPAGNGYFLEPTAVPG